MRRIAVGQMNSSANLENNLATFETLAVRAAEAGACLLVLPENCAFIGVSEWDKLNVAESPGDGIIQQTLSTLAHEYGLWIIAGTVPLKAPDGRVFGSSLVFNAEGLFVARYDKIHLFDAVLSETETYAESNTIAPGHTPVVVDTPVGCIGLSVCYDVRFPELYRELLSQGAELFIMTAAFTATTGAAHWHTLLRARAIENMCYMIASNQEGMHANGRETYGHSLIVNPWGEVMTEIDVGTGIICADIDLDYLHAQRADFPCLKHRIL
jgi:deaminated glutathione amidase